MKREVLLAVFGAFSLIFLLSFTSSVFIFTGKAILSNCTDTCFSLGYDCGTRNICGVNINCGICDSGNFSEVFGNISVCGNKIIEGREQCDGSVPSGLFCNYFGYGAGGLSCTSSCTLDFSGCSQMSRKCLDNDGGKKYLTQGILNSTSSTSLILKENESTYVFDKELTIKYLDLSNVKISFGLEISPLLYINQSYVFNGGEKITAIYIQGDTKSSSPLSINLFIESKTETLSDSCFDSSKLNEYYCDSYSSSNNIVFDCRNQNLMCLNGACATAPKCTDSDGLNFFSKGAVTYTSGGQIMNRTTYVDFCSGRYLKEASCFYDEEGFAQFGWKETFCKSGCYNGACKKWIF